MNLGDGHGQSTEGGVSAVLRSGDDDAVDPHLERIRNAAVDESDEEVLDNPLFLISRLMAVSVESV